MADFSWTDWHGHPSVIAGLVVFVAGYLLSIGPLRLRFTGSVEVEAGRVASFLAGVVVLSIALLSPLHELGDSYLFSAHMVQHLMLTLAVPPLLLMGTPPWLLRPLVRTPRGLAAGRFITRPLIAFALFNMVFVLWHFPAMYDLSLRGREIHILEHLIFLVAAVIMWWPILGAMRELPRASYPVQMLYLFLLPTVSAVMGAIITFSDSVLYEWYAEAPRLWSISALEDQQLGGVIMWVPGGLVYLFALMVVFLTWASREESSSQRDIIRSGL